MYKHYARILAQWPVDHLRPNLSFQQFIQGRVDKRLKPASPQPTSSTSTGPAAGAAGGVATPPTKFDEQAELEQINVLYSFLENRYSKKVALCPVFLLLMGEPVTRTEHGADFNLQYPLSDRIMKPASNPAYYEDLVKELDAAPGRSRWKAIWNRWKGIVRFS